MKDYIVYKVAPKHKQEEDGLVINGYKMQTTFWNDFSEAEIFGVDAIEHTFSRIFKYNHSNYIYLTELVMVLNWKMWEHYDNNEKFISAYQVLWRLADRYAVENLKDEELDYFYTTTD